jgi:UMF1 family MFS transporter
MTFLVPYRREAEYFSFYAIGGKFSAIIGPIIFGILAYYTKSEKIALLSIIAFLVSGLLMILTVRTPSSREGLK